MPRKIRKTSSGRQEEIWCTDDEGLMGAYGLKAWYQGLPGEIKNRIIEIQSSVSGAMMPAWDTETLVNGPFEIHRLMAEKWAWQYSTVPPLLATIFEWSAKQDIEIAQLVLDEWLALAKKSKSPGARFVAYRAAIEFNWQRGYVGAKAVREQGLFNQELKQVEKIAMMVVGMLVKQQLPQDMGPCKPLDRLFLLYKLTGQKESALTIISDLQQAGYGDLPEVMAYKMEFLKL